MRLAVDFGNTKTKIGLFEGSELQATYVIANALQLEKVLREFDIESMIISKVGNAQQDIVEFLNKKSEKIISLSPHTIVPIQNLYKTPETLGMDRLAAVVGASALFPNEACLVIDMGTCITYDFIDQQKNYWGGAISPGLQMRFKAMHDYTHRLPLIQKFDEGKLVGNTTESCMVSGVLNGIISELEGFIEKYLEKFGHFKAILTGGDANFFESRMKDPTFANQNLVLIGLNQILETNASDF